MLTVKLIVLADSVGTCVPHDEAFARRLQESGATETMELIYRCIVINS